MTDPHRSPEYQQLAQRFLETSETQHTRSFAASAIPIQPLPYRTSSLTGPLLNSATTGGVQWNPIWLC